MHRKTEHVSQTCKLITQITQVCKEILDIKNHRIITGVLHHPRLPGDHKGPPSDKCEKDGMDCTHSSNSKSHDWNGDPRNNQSTQTHHASDSPSPPEPPPPEPLEQQFPHTSEPASSSETSASCKPPPSCRLEDNAALWSMSCNCSQRDVSRLKFILSFNFYFRHQTNFPTFTHPLFPLFSLNDHELTWWKQGETHGQWWY